MDNEIFKFSADVTINANYVSDVTENHFQKTTSIKKENSQVPPLKILGKLFSYLCSR